MGTQGWLRTIRVLVQHMRLWQRTAVAKRRVLELIAQIGGSCADKKRKNGKRITAAANRDKPDQWGGGGIAPEKSWREGGGLSSNEKFPDQDTSQS